METFTSKIDFVKRAFGNINIARDGVNLATMCPNCGENSNKKKFSINIENWNCHCWVCDIKGKNLFRILLKYKNENLATEFKSKFLKEKYYHSASDEIIETNVKLPKGFIPLCIETNPLDPDVRDCILYLKKRGIEYRDLWYFKLGAISSGRFRRRIIIPSFDDSGDLNYFSARSIDDKSLKYINSKAKKREIIFNEININWNKEITLVEGPFDLFKCNKNATCLLGSTLSKNSYLFKRIISNKTPVLLSLDSDMKSKSVKIADMLSEYSCDVRTLNLGKFRDVGEMTRDEFSLASNSSSMWSRERSIKQKIASINTGSLF